MCVDHTHQYWEEAPTPLQPPEPERVVIQRVGWGRLVVGWGRKEGMPRRSHADGELQPQTRLVPVILSQTGVVVLARPFVGLRPLVVTIATFLSLHYSYSSQMLGMPITIL